MIALFYDTGTIKRSTSGPRRAQFHVLIFKAKDNSPHPLLYDSNSITFPVPDFNGTVKVLLPGVPPVVGKKATTCVTPLTITFAYLWVLSPFRYLMRIVVVVATVLEMPVKVNVPPGDGPPI